MRRARATIFGPLTALACAASFLSACGGGSDLQSFCDVMTDFEENDPTVGLEEGSPEFFEAATGAFREVADAAPDEISEDANTMLEAMDALAELADDPEGNSAEALSLLEEVGPATDRIDAYMESNCDS